MIDKKFINYLYESKKTRCCNKLIKIILCLFIMISMLSSCATNINDNELSSVNISQSLSNQSFTTSLYEDVVSGTLRLWIQKVDTLNPLVSKNYQFNAMIKLFYDSLFNLDQSQNLINNLVKSYEISDSGLKYTLTIKNNILFNDNTKLDTNDILATFQFIQNPANNSVYFNRTTNILSVTVLDNEKIEFNIKMIDPFFLYDLTFPILPSETLTAKVDEKPTKSTSDDAITQPLVIFPGSGQYKLTAYEINKLLKAELNTKNSEAKQNKIKKINIIILENTQKAMEAFGNDLVDMVILRDEFYEKYYLRNDVKIVRFPSNRFYFYELNQAPEKILNDKSKSDYIKVMLQNDTIYDGVNSVFIAPSKYPFISSNPLVHKDECKDILKFEISTDAFQKQSSKIEIIYIANNQIYGLLIPKIKTLLDKAKILYNINAMTKENYDKAIAAGQYDIALREAVLYENPDPSWIYLNQSIRSLPGEQLLKKFGLENYIKNMDELSKLYKDPKTRIDAKPFCSLINSSYGYGPFVGIGFKLSGVILSKRINGQLDSNAFDNYNNIKDVWVWSGQ